MSQHTPGPWMIWEEDADEIDILRDGGPDEPESDRTVATARNCREMAANARLIAAAPDLLAACIRLVTAWERGEPLHHGDPKSFGDPIGQLRAAISKATA